MTEVTEERETVTISKAAFDAVLERALLYVPTERREGVWTMLHGDLRISFPSKSSVGECELAEQFIALVMKGIRRRAEKEALVQELNEEHRTRSTDEGGAS